MPTLNLNHRPMENSGKADCGRWFRPWTVCACDECKRYARRNVSPAIWKLFPEAAPKARTLAEIRREFAGVKVNTLGAPKRSISQIYWEFSDHV